MPVAGLADAVNAGHGRSEPLSVAVTGKIRALNARSGMIALEDASGAEILEIALPDEEWRTLQVGSWVELDFQEMMFQRGGQGIQAGTGPLVELDGQHPAVAKSGRVHLSAGPQPIRVDWFHASGEAGLAVEMARAGGEMARIPEALLSHRAGENRTAPGVRFEAYEVANIAALADLAGKVPVKRGVLAGFDREVATRPENAGLVFDGLLKIPADGIYDFRLTSADGARLFVGRSFPKIRVLDGPPPPVPATARGNGRTWTTRKGRVIFVAAEGIALCLRLANGNAETEATVLDAAGLDALSLRGKWVTVSGVGGGDAIGVLGGADIRIEARDPETSGRLTKMADVRELRPDQAQTGIPVLLEGVVTMSNYRSLVIQDDSGGVFVLYGNPDSAGTPQPGEVWQIRGVTAKGDFSPVVVAETAELVRRAAMPAPRRPRWAELLNGSLDAEWVEIEGVITAVDDSKVELLTHDAPITIASRMFYPLCKELRSPEERSGYVGSRVRFHGVFATSWDVGKGRLHPGIVHLGNAMLSVDQPSAREFADVALVGIPDLWSFASKSTALNPARLKVRMMARSGEVHVASDGKNSLRLISSEPLDAAPGDRIEVEGFPRLGTISPYLLYPRVKSREAAPLPAAREISGANLQEPELDGQFVAIRATVLSDAWHQEERELEVRAGNVRFFAAGSAPAKTGGSLERDTIIRLRGVYLAGGTGKPAGGDASFELRLVGPEPVEILQAAPWWTTRRLILLVAALLGGLALAMLWAILLRRQVANRTSRLEIEIHEREHAESDRLLEEERARVARDLHDELGAGLTEIGMLNGLLQHPGLGDEARARNLETMAEVSGSLVSALDEIVWAVNPRYDSVPDSASYFWLYARRMLKSAGIECRFDQLEEIPSLGIGSRRRHALFLAFKEALNNVVRHSRAKEARLSIEVAEETVVVGIADDGSGFDPAARAAAGSDGLAGMRQRMAELGGDCTILSEPGKGTTVRLALPLRSR